MFSFGLILEYFIYFQLCPHKLAVGTSLFDQSPPKPSFDQSSHHRSIVPETHICLYLSRLHIFYSHFEVKTHVYSVSPHILPYEFHETADPFVVDLILLLTSVFLRALPFAI
jgi:hypothetical protein